MAYTKQNFEDGQVLTAEHLNNMEQGIEEAAVQTDWNQTDETAADFIKNRPFGDEVTYPDTLTVSVTVEEIESAYLSGQLVGGSFLKVADSVVSMDDLAAGFTIDFGGEEVFDVPADAVGDAVHVVGDGLIIIAEGFAAVNEQAIGVDFDGVQFTETGIYVMAHLMLETPYISLTIPNFEFTVTNVNKIDEKYIPVGYKNVPQVQADWAQTDETAVDYIKNKPIGTFKFRTTLIDGRRYLQEFQNDEWVLVTRERFRELLSIYENVRNFTVDSFPCLAYWDVNNTYYLVGYCQPIYTSTPATCRIESAYTAECTV